MSKPSLIKIFGISDILGIMLQVNMKRNENENKIFTFDAATVLVASLWRF